MLRLRLAFVSLLIAAAAWSQQGRGTILGTVTDSSGAAMPNVKLVITHTGTNLDYPTTTGGEGYYTLPNLPVGEYRITASAPGMKTITRTGVTLEVDQKAQVDFQLAPGAVSESVEVVAEAPLVDTSTDSETAPGARWKSTCAF